MAVVVPFHNPFRDAWYCAGCIVECLDRSKRNNGNPAAERTLRLLYLEKAFGKPGVSEALELIANLEDQLDQPGEFSYSDDQEWHENLVA